MQRLYAGKLSQTGHIGVDLLLTTFSLNQRMFSTGQIRAISNTCQPARYYLLPKYVNKLNKYEHTILVRKGVDSSFAHKNIKGNLLFRAIEKKDIAYLAELLDAGIHTHKKFYYTYSCRQFNEYTTIDFVPLWYAVQTKFVDGVRKLLEYNTGELDIHHSYYSERNDRRNISKRFDTLTDFMWFQSGLYNSDLMYHMDKNLDTKHLKKDQDAIKELADIIIWNNK